MLTETNEEWLFQSNECILEFQAVATFEISHFTLLSLELEGSGVYELEGPSHKGRLMSAELNTSVYEII